MNTPASAMSPSTPTRTVAVALSGPAVGAAAGADAAGAAGAGAAGGAGGAAGGAAGAQASPSRAISSEPLSHRVRRIDLPSSPRSGAPRPSPAHGLASGARRESPWPPRRKRAQSAVEAGRAG